MKDDGTRNRSLLHLVSAVVNANVLPASSPSVIHLRNHESSFVVIIISEHDVAIQSQILPLMCHHLSTFSPQHTRR